VYRPRLARRVRLPSRALSARVIAARRSRARAASSITVYVFLRRRVRRDRSH
jgi:hypothetical protein